MSNPFIGKFTKETFELDTPVGQTDKVSAADILNPIARVIFTDPDTGLSSDLGTAFVTISDVRDGHVDVRYFIPETTKPGTDVNVELIVDVSGFSISSNHDVGIAILPPVDHSEQLDGIQDTLDLLRSSLDSGITTTPGPSLGPSQIEPTNGYYDCVTPEGFTDYRAVQDLYGQLGIENILCDADNVIDERNGLTVYENTVNSVIVDAEQTVLLRLSKWFCAADLIGDPWIWSRTRWIAAYYLSQRRGNEHYFESKYMEAIRELDAIATGEIPPPKNLRLSFNSLPSMSNQCVDERFYLHKLRVQSSVSVGGTYPGQDTNYHFGFFFGSI